MTVIRNGILLTQNTKNEQYHISPNNSKVLASKTPTRSILDLYSNCRSFFFIQNTPVTFRDSDILNLLVPLQRLLLWHSLLVPSVLTPSATLAVSALYHAANVVAATVMSQQHYDVIVAMTALHTDVTAILIVFWI